MADRIVVMRDGAIRQTGSPEALYEEPDHPDVAEFMGYRTKLAGRVIAFSDGRATVESLGARIEALARRPFAVGDAVTLMVRPEDFVAGADGVAATVRISEYRGRAFFGMAEGVGGAELFFRSPQPVRPGDSVRLAAEPQQIRVFSEGEA